MNAQELKTHQWNHRVVIVYTADKSNETFQKQLTILQNTAKGMLDRKLILYTVVDDHFELHYFDEKPTQKGTLNTSLRSVIHEREAFEVLLIGLDGGVKLRQTEIVTIEKLFNTIDAMPMRQREMQNKKQ